MTATEPVLDVQQLAKTYKTFRKDPGLKGTIKSFVRREEVSVAAVKPTSFQIRRGEFVGLLGPNGAGKTTILKMLTGLIPPTTGSARAFGEFDTRDRAKPYLRRIGMVMGQRNQLHPDLPAMDSFRLSQAIYGIPEERFQKRLKTCLELFQIGSKIDIPVRKLSLGERMKMELILAILHEPELLFLDEPTIGLDFNAAKQIRSFLKDANQNLGITTILTSHYTKDIEELCRRVIVINHGMVIYDGVLDGLDQRLKGERVVTLVAKDQSSLTNLNTWIANSSDMVLQKSIEEDEPLSIKLAVASDLISSVQHSLWKTFDGNSIKDIRIEERSLEDVFSDLYARGPHQP